MSFRLVSGPWNAKNRWRMTWCKNFLLYEYNRYLMHERSLHRWIERLTGRRKLCFQLQTRSAKPSGRKCLFFSVNKSHFHPKRPNIGLPRCSIYVTPKALLWAADTEWKTFWTKCKENSFSLKNTSRFAMKNCRSSWILQWTDQLLWIDV